MYSMISGTRIRPPLPPLPVAPASDATDLPFRRKKANSPPFFPPLPTPKQYLFLLLPARELFLFPRPQTAKAARFPPFFLACRGGDCFLIPKFLFLSFLPKPFNRVSVFPSPLAARRHPMVLGFFFFLPLVQPVTL